MQTVEKKSVGKKSPTKYNKMLRRKVLYDKRKRSGGFRSWIVGEATVVMADEKNAKGLDITIPIRYQHLSKKVALEFTVADRIMLLSLAKNNFTDAISAAIQEEKEYLLTFRNKSEDEIDFALSELNNFRTTLG